MHQFSSGASAWHSETISILTTRLGRSARVPLCILTLHCKVSLCSICLECHALEIKNEVKSELTWFQLQRQDEHVNYG